MCTEATVIRNGSTAWCNVRSELAAALELPHEKIPTLTGIYGDAPRPANECLCPVDWNALAALVGMRLTEDRGDVVLEGV